MFAAIDSCFKGKERNQIPMFAVSVTKPFRLTDATYESNFTYIHCIYSNVLIIFLTYILNVIEKCSHIIDRLNELISYSTQTINVLFKQANMCSRVTISLFMEPYLNVIRIKVLDLPNVEINFFNSIPTKRNNLFQDQHEKECWIHNPQINEVIISNYYKNFYML